MDVVIDVKGFNVPSGVPDQPIGDAETKEGAVTRARRAFHAYIKASKEEGMTLTYEHSIYDAYI